MFGAEFVKKAGLSCLFLFLFHSLKAEETNKQCYFLPEQQRAYQALLNLDFDQCLRLLKGHHPYNFQIKSLTYCIEAFIFCDKKKYQTGRQVSLKWQDSISQFSEREELRFVKAQIKLHWAFLASAYGEKLAAAFEIRQAYLLLKENYRLYPAHKPTLLYYGLLNSFISDIPDSYRWLANIAGLNTGGRNGESMIRITNNCNPILDFERNALVLLRKPVSDEQEEALVKACRYLREKHGDENFTNLIVAFCYLKNKRTSAAAAITAQLGKRTEPLLIYQKALTAYHLLDIDTAIFYFKKFNRVNNSESFKKDVNLKLAYLYSLEGDSVQAGKYLTTVRKTGNDAIYADKSADKLAAMPIPGFHLLKGRILFDAGNWKDAERFLLLWKPETKKEKTEYYYRLGKCSEEMGNLTDAKRNYLQCLANCPMEGLYYGPFACLNLAEIALKQENELTAKYYLKTSEGYSDFEYQQTYQKRLTGLKQQLK